MKYDRPQNTEIQWNIGLFFSEKNSLYQTFTQVLFSEEENGVSNMSCKF